MKRNQHKQLKRNTEGTGSMIGPDLKVLDLDPGNLKLETF